MRELLRDLRDPWLLGYTLFVLIVIFPVCGWAIADSISWVTGHGFLWPLNQVP